MARKKMIRQLIMPFTLIIVISMIILIWFSYNSLKSFYLEETQNNLYSRTVLLKPLFISALISSDADYEQLQALVKQLGTESEVRITLMLPSGKVVVDSEEDPLIMENHAQRTEMLEALEGKTGKSIRHSNTLQKSMMYLAVPLEHEGHVLGVLRLSVSTSALDRTLRELLLKISISVFIITIIATTLTVIISRKVSKPLEILKLGAERFAQGNFGQMLPLSDSYEIARLAEAMNAMAVDIDERIKIITRQGNEQKAILQSMVEGVVAVNKNEKIINMNKAASFLFNIPVEQALGKSVREVIRNATLQDSIKATLSENRNFEGEISAYVNRELFISYSSTVLRDASNNIVGALIVLNDLTHLRYLENVRRDFVANVSHELRTPITSIKGFVETLIDGRVENEEDYERFLNIISKQVDRLNSIIEDLLSLSRIEQDSEKGDVTFVEARIIDVIKSSIEICGQKAKIKNIEIELDVDEALSTYINIPLLEQAVINLLDNAIKYSKENGHIRIVAKKDNSFIIISVCDNGQGIENKHLSRIFERFYRIDKARSRELGGTGLGLAIVKHIALAHGGSVSVDSKIGEGSQFHIHIPVSI